MNCNNLVISFNLIQTCKQFTPSCYLIVFVITEYKKYKSYFSLLLSSSYQVVVIGKYHENQFTT